MYTTIRAAAVNFKPRPWGKDDNADHLEALFAQAVEAGAELVVGPEGILDGYVAMQALTHHEKRAAMLDIAEPIDGPFVTRFRKLAAQWHVCLAFGITARIGKRDLYNLGVFIDQDGNIRGTHAKAQFAEGYLPNWYFNRIGNTLRAFDTPLGRCGILICNERWNPLTARALCLDGARFLCILTYGEKTRRQDNSVLARARENGVPIVQSNVGCNLLISKGEIVARGSGHDIVTPGEIDIPAPPNTRNARAVEREFLIARNANLAEARDYLRNKYEVKK